ncbi:MAG: hypothetical protein ASUL_07259 [Candidatus Aramenus sulfurataquae]|uniref:Uncharacterized protein n=1 Tax=Candidatus Aramenus sulfurataquae TaxID=1326980 RepID=W7KL81_9CREN|nr:MAG: hypothetical protein ASUL_07259 [Candidatus Aramenus sulfurataquae]
MQALSLDKLSRGPISTAAEAAKRFSQENGFVPLISFYLEEKLLSSLVKSLEPSLKSVFKEYHYERTTFIRKACQVLACKELKATEFPYYAIPVSERSEVTFVENNAVPPKAIVNYGTFRFIFMPHPTYASIDEAIKKQAEDNIIVEFKDGRITNVEKKRSIFIESKSVDRVVEAEKVVVYLTSTLETFLIPPIVAMNVRLLSNRVEILRKEEILEYRVIEGKASQEEVLKGDTLSPSTKAGLYYDYKKKAIIEEEIIQGIVSKFPL